MDYDRSTRDHRGTAVGSAASAPKIGASTLVQASQGAPEQASKVGGNTLAGKIEASVGTGATTAPGGGGGGQGLPDDLRAKFEGSLGTDLSKVRVHTDTPVATGAGARAIAHGQDIHMAPGEYDPRSAPGEKLLAHEVAHTVQQQRATPHPQAKGDRPAPAGSGAEHDADQAADAMVTGKPAHVSAVSEQRPHATEHSRDELMHEYKASLANQNWADVALRLNGFSKDDITMLVGQMTGGQHAHVREAAEVAMPGWSQRVTNEIDAADSNASRIATLYAAYEKAVAAAKTSGDWHEVVNRLNGMGKWDMQDRLKKLTWFDYEAMRAQTDNTHVLDEIDKADTARVKRTHTAYQQAIANHNWKRAATELHGMSEEDIRAKLDVFASKPDQISILKRLKEAAPSDARLVALIDEVARAHGQVVPDPLVVTPICDIPDVSDDRRPLQGLDLTSFAGNAKVAKFAADLAAAYSARRATSGRKDNTDTAKVLAGQLATSFKTTGKNFQQLVLATFAKEWMSEMRERADLDSGAKLSDVKLPGDISALMHSQEDLVQTELLQNLDPTHGTSDGAIKDKTGNIKIPGQRVHPFVNSFMKALAENASFTAMTRTKHGGSANVAPFCLDVLPSIPLDDRGLYQPDQMIEFIEKINDAAGNANWSGIYNDTAVLRELPKHGLAGKVDTQAKDGTTNFHGALNLHIHLYLWPPRGWVPPTPEPSSAPDAGPAN